MAQHSLPHFSTVTPKPDTHPLNSTTLDNHETDTPVKICTKTNFSLPPPFQNW